MQLRGLPCLNPIKSTGVAIDMEYVIGIQYSDLSAADGFDHHPN